MVCVLINFSHAACIGNYTFEGTNWTVGWGVSGSNISFLLFGPVDGWIGIGFSEAPGLDSVSFVTWLSQHSTHCISSSLTVFLITIPNENIIVCIQLHERSKWVCRVVWCLHVYTCEGNMYHQTLFAALVPLFSCVIHPPISPLCWQISDVYIAGPGGFFFDG